MFHRFIWVFWCVLRTGRALNALGDRCGEPAEKREAEAKQLRGFLQESNARSWG